MLNSKKNLICIGTIILVFSIVLNTGCIGQAEDVTTDKGTISFGVPPWAAETVKTEVARIVLEEMGYKTTVAQLDAGIVYAEMAEGNIDATCAAWLPATHAEYWTRYGDNLELVHISGNETWLGLAVPSYVYDAGIRSITDLPGNEENFGGRIVGIEPGAGIMINTERAINIYGLNGYVLASSSEPAMMAELDAAIANNEWIVVTKWKPHPAFFLFDIKELEDPEFVYGEEGDKIYTVARKGFAQDFPEAYEFFKKFEVTAETEGFWSLRYQQGTSARAVAQDWINDNRDLVNQWIS